VADPTHDAAQALLDALTTSDPSIGAQLDARADALRDALAARAQPTTDHVVWEGPTGPSGTYRSDGTEMSMVFQRFDDPPGTRVRVVRATDRCPECGGEGARGCGAAWHDPHRATDQPNEDQRPRLVQISKDHGATWWDLPDHAHWKLFAADPGLPVGQTYEAPNGDLYRWRWADQPTEVADDA
jgi:hypothetical protein